MRRAVGAAAILLTFTVTSCSPSDPEPDRSWSEFEACARAFSSLEEAPAWHQRMWVENYRNGTDSNPFPSTIECEKVMPLSD